jgi:beta-barrel assembly-enhancing protease
MKSKLRIIARIMVLSMISGVLISCASPQSRPPVATSSEIQEETKKERAMAVKAQMEAQIKLSGVSSRLMAGASPLCDKKKQYAGFFFVHREQFSPEHRDALADLYGVKELPKIVAVFEKSPAEKAGIKSGDQIISINGAPFPQRPEEIGRFVSSWGTNAVLDMEVLRGESTLHIDIEQAPYCDYPVVLLDSNEVNAAADGEKIYVTRGLMRFMDNDSELAAVIGHELAHNTRGHVTMAKKNSLAAGLGGLLLDIAAAAAGVNTQAAFSKAGMNIGQSLYSKDMEREADYVGLYILALSGYNIDGAPNIFRRLGTANPKSIEGKYAVSHPSTPERYVYLEKTVEEIVGKQSAGLALVPEEKK